MTDSVTVQYGPWSPDLQDVATEIPGPVSPLKVACADVLNVYFQDGTFRCLPSPQAFAPSVGAQVLTAFTWYDEVNGQEIVFTGNSAGITALVSAVIGGPLVPTTIGVENALNITVTGVSLKLVLGGKVQPLPVKLGLTLGTPTITRTNGTIFTGTMVPGTSGQGKPPNTTQTTGYQYGVIGSLSPTSDFNHHTISAIYSQAATFNGTTTFRTYVTINAANLGQAYFAALTVGGTSLPTSAAQYGSSGGVSSWAWSGALSIVAGNTYSVKLG